MDLVTAILNTPSYTLFLDVTATSLSTNPTLRPQSVPPIVIATPTPPPFSQEYLNEYNGHLVYITCGVFLLLCSVFLILRFAARRMASIRWGPDDTYTVCSAISLFALITVCLVSTAIGKIGYHEQHFPPAGTNDAVRRKPWTVFLLAICLTYLPSVAFPKLAILATYLRVFASPLSRAACWATGILVTLNCIGSMVPAAVLCVPYRKAWEPHIAGKCINVDAWMRYSTVVNLVTDLICMILPIPVILGTKLPGKVKVALVGTFLVGSIGTVMATVRFVGFFANDFGSDGTWTAVRLMQLSVMESSFYLIAVCLLSFRPLMIRLWQALSLSSRWGSWGTVHTDRSAPTRTDSTTSRKIHSHVQLKSFSPPHYCTNCGANKSWRGGSPLNDVQGDDLPWTGSSIKQFPESVSRRPQSPLYMSPERTPNAGRRFPSPPMAPANYATAEGPWRAHSPVTWQTTSPTSLSQFRAGTESRFDDREGLDVFPAREKRRW